MFSDRLQAAIYKPFQCVRCSMRAAEAKARNIWVDEYGTGSGRGCVKTQLYAEAKTLATWVDEYGTGSDSDRMQPTIRKPFNARIAAQAKYSGELSQRFALIILNVYHGINHVTLSP